MFIVFEGPDGSGTSTQANLLAENLQKTGKKVFSTHEPSNHFLGKSLREILQHKRSACPKAVQLLFFADRAEHVEKEIIPALKRGEIVICERYFWSSIAYGYAEGVNPQFLENIAKSFLEPDITFFCDLDPQISLERIARRGQKIELFEKKEVLSEVREKMLYLANPSAFTKKAVVVDARKSVKEIEREILIASKTVEQKS